MDKPFVIQFFIMLPDRADLPSVQPPTERSFDKSTKKGIAMFYWHYTINFKAYYKLLKFQINSRRFFKTAIYYSVNRLYLLQN